MKGEIWFEEQLGDYQKRSYCLLETLYESRSEYQKIEILKLANQGITLVLDGKARVFEVDEFIYHEGITYPALSRHPEARSVLVIGDGDGGIIRELIKHKYLSRIDWVEIDQKVIEICERFLPSFPKHFSQDKRVNLIIEDGLDYLTKCYEQYDIIYMSVTADRDNCYSDALHKSNVLRLIKRVLKPNGIATLSLDEFSACSFY
jgi:spermidine synthase